MKLTFVEPTSTEETLFFWETRQAVRENLHNSESFTLTETRRFLELNSRNYRIAVADGIFVGYFRFSTHFSECQIGADISPKYQGLGLARPLYQEFCLQVLLPLGIQNLSLRVLKSNSRAKSLYDSMGFQVSEETPLDFEMRCSLKDLISLLKEEGF